MRSVIGNRIVLCSLVLVAIGVSGWLAMLSWQVYGPGGWRDQVYALEGLNGTRRAMDDYRRGHLRLYRLGGEQELAQYTGQMNGVFEVWTLPHYPSMGRAHRYSTEQFIRFYNQKMEYMYAHPEKFPRVTPAVQQDSPENGSQPLRS